MKTSKESLADVAHFIKRHYVESTVWKEGALDNWISWAATHGYLMIASDDEENPVGVIIARTVNQIPAKQDLMPFDEDGKIIYIDFAVAPDRDTQKALCWALLQRYGARPFVAFRHNARTEEPDNVRIHESKTLLKALLQLEE